MSSLVSTLAGGSHAGAPARRQSRLVSSALIFAALYIAASFAAEAETLPKAVQIGAALLPIPAFVVFLVAWIRNIRNLDELERRVQLESLAFAFPMSIVLLMGLGLLQRVAQLNPADWSYRHIWPFLVAFYFFGLVLARRRYR